MNWKIRKSQTSSASIGGLPLRQSDPGGSGDKAASLVHQLVERIPATGAGAAEPAAFTSSTIRAGLIGVSAIRMPNASRACSIALMMAAAAGITPHSPTPLTPSGLSGEGETW